ncbi:MAG: HPr family phosphocarrier protein [candidate division KSB1 bacterium]|nr:HPr family phosphocarrier protein [candidate division KSB1 bacterium]MDZ7334201.1 HPr family phosphocarrier protein [candidate division KSB1 bacterium]MDZ7357470.1 HPr family phosphocarrier protein [candidate division KSB1 bacterium]MDZ7376687.1 HPr family phosphocarrier protein [candidate division KSB1 bacterium]MDZ7400894.1 HPr family phosphocarrier protein [candidate division KSB1 bacterium]
MLVRKVTILNSLGLHARPSAQFVKVASKFKSDVYLSKNDREVNGKSIMGVMTLAAEMGSTLTIRVDGEDEELAMEALVNLVNAKFYEE